MTLGIRYCRDLGGGSWRSAAARGAAEGWVEVTGLPRSITPPNLIGTSVALSRGTVGDHRGVGISHERDSPSRPWRSAAARGAGGEGGVALFSEISDPAQREMWRGVQVSPHRAGTSLAVLTYGGGS